MGLKEGGILFVFVFVFVYRSCLPFFTWLGLQSQAWKAELVAQRSGCSCVQAATVRENPHALTGFVVPAFVCRQKSIINPPRSHRLRVPWDPGFSFLFFFFFRRSSYLFAQVGILMTRKFHSLGSVSELTDRQALWQTFFFFTLPSSWRLFFKPVPAGLRIDVRSTLLPEWTKSELCMWRMSSPESAANSQDLLETINVDSGTSTSTALIPL